jgi:hypothetical protein
MHRQKVVARDERRGVKGAMNRCLAAFLALFALMVPAGQPSAEPAQAPSVLDRVEMWLELPAQSRLAETKAMPGVTLAPFVTDGCSGGLSAGWEFAARHVPALAAAHGELPPWEHCCVAHDRAYHAAPGVDAASGFAARRAADAAMRACVLAEGQARKPALMADYGVTAGMVDLLYDGIAGAMYRAVRLGGAPCSALPWRWGYGWPYCD